MPTRGLSGPFVKLADIETDIDEAVAEVADMLGEPQEFTATAASTTSLTATALVDVGSKYIGQMAVPLSGNMIGEGRYITAYDGTQTITVAPAWAASPGNVAFIIIPSETGVIYDALFGVNGIATFPAAAAPADNVSIAEVIRYIVENQNVATANATTNIMVSDVVGNKTDAAMQDGDATEKSIIALTKGLHDVLWDTDGVIAWAAAAAPANGVSISEAIRYIVEKQIGTEFDSTPDLYDVIVTGFTDAVTATVQGSILERLESLIEMNGRPFQGETDASTVNTITCAELTATADQYIGQMVVPLAGATIGLGRTITAYNESTKVLTVIPDYPSDPDAGGNIRFTIIPVPDYFLYVAGKGMEAVFDVVDGIPVLTRIGGTHDQSDAAGTEDTLWISDAPGGNWEPKVLTLDLTEMVAEDDLTVKIHYRMTTSGDWLINVNETYNGVPIKAMLDFPLLPNRFGLKITLAQNAGTVRDYLFEVYYGG